MIFLPAGRSSTSTPGSSPPVLLGLDEPQPALAAGEERRRDLLEVLGDGVRTSLRSAARPSRRARRAASRAPSGSASRSCALRLELREPLLLRLVLLLRERIDLAELDRGAARAARRASRARRGRRPRPAPRLPLAAGGARRRPRPRSAQLDLDLRRPLGRLLGAPAELDLGRAELAQRRSQLARALCAGVDAGAERRLEAVARPPRPPRACPRGARPRLARAGAGRRRALCARAPGRSESRVAVLAASAASAAASGELLGRLGQVARVALDLPAFGPRPPAAA